MYGPAGENPARIYYRLYRGRDIVCNPNMRPCAADAKKAGRTSGRPPVFSGEDPGAQFGGE